MNCLDSDIMIAFMRRDENAREAIEGIKGEISTTVINAFEILYQAKGFSERKKSMVEKFLRMMTILPLDTESMFRAVDTGHDLAKKGKMLDTMDLFIGSIVLTNSFTLYTRNEKHFSRIKNLKLKRW